MEMKKSILLTNFFLFVFLIQAFAQLDGTTLSSVKGVVRDENNNTLQGVKIIVLNINLPLNITDKSGSFTIPASGIAEDATIQLKVVKHGFHLPFATKEKKDVITITSEQRKKGEVIAIELRKNEPRLPLRVAVLPFCMMGTNNPYKLEHQAFTSVAMRVYQQLDDDKIIPISPILVKRIIRDEQLNPAQYCNVSYMTQLATRLNADLMVYGEYQFYGDECQVWGQVLVANPEAKTTTSAGFVINDKSSHLNSIQTRLYLTVLEEIGIAISPEEQEAIQLQAAGSAQPQAIADNLNGTDNYGLSPFICFINSSICC